MKLNLKNINLLKSGIVFGALIFLFYAIFLISPFLLSPLMSSYSNEAEQFLSKITGLEFDIDSLGIYSTPSLNLGIKADKLYIKNPDDSTSILSLTKAKGDLKLLPLLIKRIQLGKISAENIDINLAVKKTGEFALIDYFPTQNDEQAEMNSLPFGLKLSNNLPDFSIGNYKIVFANDENKKLYYLEGQNFNVSKFILDKRIKLSTKGVVVFDNRVVSNYDIALDNSIMPKIQLDDLVFPKEVIIDGKPLQNPDNKNDSISINILDIFDAVNKNQFKADVNMNAKVYGTFKKPVQKGLFELYNISTSVNGVQLPESYVKLIFKGIKTDIDSTFYTSNDKYEQTHIIGNISSGKNRKIDLTFRSNAKLNNIIRLLDSTFESFGVKDFATLSATGKIDADFNVNSDLKYISSTGYIKVEPSSLKYGKYNLSVDDITADIDFMHDNINVKNAGFSILGHPLKLSGDISSEAFADLKLTADRLPLKGLLLTAGQIGLLNDNDINSGTISLDAVIRGVLTEITPDIKFIAENINVFNKSAGARLLLNNAIVKLLLSDNKMTGNVDVNSFKVKLNGASVSVPKASIVMDPKDININDTYVLVNNSRINIKGSVKDYLNEKFNMNISASGNLASSDIMAFVPREFYSMFPYKGALPLKVLTTGNSKEQNIAIDLSASPSGYVRFLNIDKLRGKTTKIHSDIKVNGDNLKLENSALYGGTKQIFSFNGNVTNLANPNLNIHISVPENISFTIPGLNDLSNITANGNINIIGKIDNPNLKGKVNISDISLKDMDFSLTNLVANLNGEGISGSAAAEKMKFGGISASDISAKFSLKDYTYFYLENIIANCFNGKVNGKLSYNIPNFAFSTDLTGKGLNSMDAVYGAVGITKALTGTLGFSAKLSGKGVTDTDIIKSLKGNINFDVNDGRFISIGKWENLVAAQNVTSNSILKSAISAMSTVGALQETDKFKSIKGELSMSGGNANIHSIFVSGPLMSYYVKGIYNVLNNTAYLTILGRLDSKVVSYLGPLGQLSMQKLVSYIPGFGKATARMLELMTQNPSNEMISLIPALSNGSKDYKDFKTIFNGAIDKASSVKSFKWLSVCDTTKMNLAQDGKDAVQAVKDNINNQAEALKNTAETMKKNTDEIINIQKQNIELQKQTVEQAKNNLKNIKQNMGQSSVNFNNLLKNAASNAGKSFEPASTKPVESAPVTTESKSIKQESEVQKTSSDSEQAQEGGSE